MKKKLGRINYSRPMCNQNNSTTKIPNDIRVRPLYARSWGWGSSRYSSRSVKATYFTPSQMGPFIRRGSSLSAATGIPTNRSMLHIPTSTTASIVLLLTLLQQMSVEIDIRLISTHAIASTLDFNKSYNEATDTRK